MSLIAEHLRNLLVILPTTNPKKVPVPMRALAPMRTLMKALMRNSNLLLAPRTRTRVRKVVKRARRKARNRSRKRLRSQSRRRLRNVRPKKKRLPLLKNRGLQIQKLLLGLVTSLLAIFLGTWMRLGYAMNLKSSVNSSVFA